MKACPGLRSGIDRSGSLSFAIRGIPSPIRPPIRHSSESWNPEGVGRGKATRRWKKLTRRPISILLCGLRKAMVIPAKAGIQRGGVGCGNDTGTLPPTNAPNFHTLVCRHQPAWAIGTKACPGLRSGMKVPATHLVVGTRMAGSRRESKERLVALGLVPSHVHPGSPPQNTDRRVGRQTISGRN